MRRLPWILSCALLAGGCQTLYEELPSSPTAGTTAGEPVATQPVNVTPVDLPIPVEAAPAPAATPEPAREPEPAATPTPNRGSIDSIRVGFFGISCKNGKDEPRNGERRLPTGCRGFVTATPKRADNSDVPAREHGPDIDWELQWGDGQVDVVAPTFESDFNKDLVGRSPGGFSLCATVKGVTGCLNGEVIP